MKPLKADVMSYSDAVSSFLQKLKHDNSSTPRMLTPSEQRSLRLHARETGAQAKAIAKQQGSKFKAGRDSINRYRSG